MIKLRRITVFGGVYWLNPVGLVLTVLLPLLLVCYCISPTTYEERWETPKYFSFYELWLAISTLSVFCLGAVVSLSGHREGQLDGGYERIKAGYYDSILRRFYYLASFLTIAGLMLWIALMVRNGLRFSHIVQLFSGASGMNYQIRGYSEFIPGVTTFMQLHVPVVLLYIMLFSRSRGWWFHGAAVAVFLGAIFRAFVNSERLALVEILLPAFVLWLRFFPGKFGRGVMMILPLLGAFLFYVFFTLSEVVRFWSNVAQDGSYGLWNFGAYHLLGYYATALNNGSGFLQAVDSNPLPTTVFNFFFNFPVVKQYIPYIFDASSVRLLDGDLFLKTYLNERFNNPSGIYPVVQDVGVIGAMVLWFFAGMALGFLYRSYRAGGIMGLALYPFAFLGLSEVLRIFYWSSTRAFPIWIFMIMIVAVLSRIRFPVGPRVGV